MTLVMGIPPELWISGASHCSEHVLGSTRNARNASLSNAHRTRVVGETGEVGGGRRRAGSHENRRSEWTMNMGLGMIVMLLLIFYLVSEVTNIEFLGGQANPNTTNGTGILHDFTCIGVVEPGPM